MHKLNFYHIIKYSSTWDESLEVGIPFESRCGDKKELDNYEEALGSTVSRNNKMMSPTCHAEQFVPTLYTCC